MPASSPAPPSQRIADIAAGAEREARRKAAGFRWDPVRGRAGPPPAPSTEVRRPLTVLAGDGGKSVFAHMSDPRVNLLAPGRAGAAAPDLVVLTRAHRLPEDPRALGLEDQVWRRLGSGETKLVLDISGEGMPHAEARSSGFHRFLQAAGIDPADCVYISQDRAFADDYAAHRQAQGHEGPGFEVLVYDRFIQSLCAAIHDDGEAIFRQRLGAYAAAPARRERRFVSLNNTFRSHRALFLMRLLRDGLWDQGHISVGAFDINRGQISKRMHALTELRPLVEALYPLLDELEARSPRYIGLGDRRPSGGADRAMIVPQMFEEYASSWFSVVIETDTTDRLHRITEKPFKPLLCLQPFIVMGAVGSLRLIREYGFRTFPGLFDESYDDEPSLKARFEHVYQEVVRLCGMDEAGLARLNDEAAEAVVFNARWGLTELPRLFRERIDAPLVDWLIGFAGRRQARL